MSHDASESKSRPVQSKGHTFHTPSKGKPFDAGASYRREGDFWKVLFRDKGLDVSPDLAISGDELVLAVIKWYRERVLQAYRGESFGTCLILDFLSIEGFVNLSVSEADTGSLRKADGSSAESNSAASTASKSGENGRSQSLNGRDS